MLGVGAVLPDAGLFLCREFVRVEERPAQVRAALYGHTVAGAVLLFTATLFTCMRVINVISVVHMFSEHVLTVCVTLTPAAPLCGL